jgi:hypothetical protein
MVQFYLRLGFDRFQRNGTRSKSEFSMLKPYLMVRRAFTAYLLVIGIRSRSRKMTMNFADGRQDRDPDRRSTMKSFVKVVILASAILLPVAAAQAQAYQGSNQAADDAMNWAAAGGHQGGAYAQERGR